MLKFSSWKRLHGLTGVAVVLGALLALASARPAGAQLACYTQSPYLMDNCGNPNASQADYEFRYANGGYFAYADGTNYLVFCKANDLTIFNVGNPVAPTSLTSTHIPWDWNSIDTGGDTHGPYKSHLWDVASTGNFRYAIVPMGEYGWDFLRISGGTRGFLGKGFKPAQVLGGNEYVSAAVFSDGTSTTWAAAQKLDQGSIASGDTTIKIYQIGTANELTAGLSSANMTPLAQVNDPASFVSPMGGTKLWVVNFGGSRLLFARRTSGTQPALLIANISNPASPQVVNIIQNDTQLFGGIWAMDEGHSTVWVADKTKYLVHAYKIVQTLGIPALAYQYSVTWWGTGTENMGGAATLSAAGNLLIVSSLTKVGYLSLAGGQATRLPEDGAYTNVSLLPPSPCYNPNFGKSVNKLHAFQVALQHYVVRSMIVSADIVGVNGSCISTTPLPDFTVTGGSAGATCLDGTAYDQADAGFPGDTFTIKDASAGVWDTATLVIKNPAGTTIQTSQINNYGDAVTWTPAANATPGDYTVTLSITGGDPPSKTKVISLCGDPQAALAISQGSAQMLVGESVNVSAAATAGHPNGYTFYVVPTGQQLSGNGSTLAQAYTLPAKSTYTFGVVAHYDFAGADTGCSGAPGGYLAANHDSCATVAVVAGYGVSSFVVLQNGQQIAPPQGGSLMVNQPTVLKFTGKVASNRAPNFVWNIANVAPHLSCQFTAWPYTDSTCGPIPAGTWTAGNPFTMNMDLQVCEGVPAGTQGCTGGTVADTITAVPAVTVTPTLNSITFSASKTSVNVGEAITVTLGQIIPGTTGYSSLLVDFGGMSCDGVRQDRVSCRNIVNQYVCTQGSQVAAFSYAASEAGTTRNVTITGTLSAGGTVQSASLPIAIGTSGTCPCPTVTATISGPTSTSVGQNVPFSASASAGGHAITSWSWTFGDGGTATGPSVSHSWSSAGTYQVRVTATSDCGNTDTDTSTIVVGGGGGGNLTITPTPATVDPGTQVAFTFSPGVSRSGDQVSFNFGDGTPTQAVTYMSIFCNPTSPCDSITHTYSTAGNYTVTGGGTAGGLAVSGSTTVTVKNTCTLPSAPAAAFTWLPSVVRIGEVVQFQDASTGDPTSWSWSFGGPGVAGSTSAQTFAVPLAGLTVTPNDATPNAGQQVTFTFSPGVSVSGDAVTFNFGDGTPTQAVTYMSIFCNPTSPCDSITHTYSTAGTYTVTASGRAGGTAGLSGTTQVVVGGGGGGGTLTITPNPASPTVGQNVIFVLSPTVSQSGDTMTITFGDGQQYTVGYPCPLGACGAVHAYSTAGTYTVSVSGTAGGAPVSGSIQLVVGGGGGGGTLTITPNPASPTVGQNVIFVLSPTVSQSGDTMTITFGDGQQYTVGYPCPLGACGAVHAYSTAGTYTVSASGTAGGAAVSGSTTVVVGGGGGGGTSIAQNPTFTYTEAGTYTVALTATNCKGSNQTARQIVVLGPCTQTEAPVADFTWGPTGELPGYPEQQQPYVGQQVTLTDNSTNEPDQWHWYDFQEDLVDSTVTTRTFTHTWSQPGDKNVRMTAHNCSGLWSPSEILKTVHIYEDVRHVTADFSWSPSAPSTGAQVTFTAAQGPAYGDPTGFTWTFDDGSTQSGPSVTYAFECGGSRRVTLTAARGGTTGSVTKSIPVDGPSCGPESVMGVDAAKLQGLNDTNWRADVRVYNPSAFPTSITLQFLPVGKDNVDPFTVGPYQPPVAPRGTLVLDDILQWVKQNFGQDFSKTALRFTYKTDDDVPPIITIRTYNLRPDGSKYGQINPGVNVVPGTTPAVQWISGLRNNGVTEGFRTNYSIVNLRGDPGGIGGITFTIFDAAGTSLGSKTFGLAPFGYIQDSIKALFGPAFENIGTFSLKVDVPTGGDVQVYASVMDNHTGDPVLIPATPPSDSPIYLPAIAHLSGEAGTVWRTDLQITNPDANAHTWEIKYTPKAGNGLPAVAPTVTVAGRSSIFVNDLVEAVYGEALPTDAQTSGILRIAPTDGSTVYPAVAARSYNLTATGTFGQGIAPLWAAKGVTAPDPTLLVLTGMSSEDIARTNLGFVNLSETQGVNFVVFFYDEGGNVLNPPGTDSQPKPYSMYLAAGTWDQDKLENRFKNAFKVSLPANLRAITAEIRVTDGGPGFAYATVIDNQTGDPNFIPAQLTP